MTTLTQAQFARHLGVDKAHVTRLKQAGRLVMTVGGHVRVEESEALIADTSDPAKAPVAALHAAARTAAVDGGKLAKTDEEKSVAKRRAEADLDHAEAKAATAMIELQRLLGTLMETEAAHTVLADVGATCRAALETLPAILAPQLATLNDENAIRQLLEEHIGAALNELCDRLAGVGG